MRSGLRSRVGMAPNSARPPSGAVPYLEPGVVSPTQPTVITVEAAAAEGAEAPDAEAFGDGDFLAPPEPGVEPDVAGPADVPACPRR